ncbi:MAG TPA: hypothetical protein VL403_07110 [Candidatus Kryptonia bacterium]|nr:hypothetical protein [Candidatus Kryptonia bacterium]
MSGQRGSVDGSVLRKGVNELDELNAIGGARHRCHGAMEAVLRMPMPRLVVIRGFDLRFFLGLGDQMVVMMMMRCEVIVMSNDVMVVIVVVGGVDVGVVTSGVMMKVESGARRYDRRHEERDRQRRPLRQLPAYPLHRPRRLPQLLMVCHGDSAR